jgi:hypothetical protein
MNTLIDGKLQSQKTNGKVRGLILICSLLFLTNVTALAQREHCGPGGCWIEISSVQMLQTVKVQTLRASYPAVFQSDLQVFPNREAQGFLQLLPAGRPDDEILVSFEHGVARLKRDGTVAGVVLLGRTARGRTVIVMITPDASEDCLIYTTVGTDVRPASWEVPGRLTAIRR